jgi:D-alanyl-D-alanine carboxypeptidase
MIPPVGVDDDGQPLDLMTSGSIAAQAPATTLAAAEAENPLPDMPSDAAGWIVQVGAAPTQDGAAGLIFTAGQKVRSLAQFQGFVQRFDKDGQTYFRARFGGISEQGTANDICKQLKQEKMSCLAMQG